MFDKTNVSGSKLRKINRTEQIHDVTKSITAKLKVFLRDTKKPKQTKEY